MPRPCADRWSPTDSGNPSSAGRPGSIRAEPCTLIVFIDDATSRLLALRLVPAETTRAYMETLAEYLRQHGRPVALYSDRHSIFRVNHPQREGELTPFSRALKTLDIAAIHAHSPQAKGRVERANQTLQDRLVQELRLRDICDLDTANAFLPAFIQDYNRRFSVAPQNPNEVHRLVLHKESELARIRCLHHTRTLSKNRTCRFHNREYPVQTQAPGLYPAQGGHHRMRGLQRERDPAVSGATAPVPPACGRRTSDAPGG